MIKIFISDDEPKMLSDISEYVRKTISAGKIAEFRKSSELLAALKNEGCDILLLDIDMPELSGLDIARELSGLSDKPVLIFVTSHDELVYDSLQFHPFGFVRKAYLEKELSTVLGDALKELDGRDRHFHFRSSDGDVKIKTDEILYFEADGNYIKLFTANAEYRFRDTVTSLENALSGNGFVRIHKGFLVNQSGVKMINAEECVLENDVRLPVGRSYSENARKQLMRYMLR
ncbi:MAG: response regulator transcription factor [Ruminiclostridium sp.]|nr:response regulator transcription factor [Ruminiclostridium sp.]